MDKTDIKQEQAVTEEKKTEDEIVINMEESHLTDFEKENAFLKLQLQEAKDQVLRGLADAENLRKRFTKEIQDSQKYAISNFAKEMTSVLENLYRATDHLNPELLENEQISKIAQGVDMTRKELINILEKQGVKRILPQVGDKFDHNIHQAISQMANPDCPNDTVMAVVEAGYVLNDRLLKPAMVVVAKNS